MPRIYKRNGRWVLSYRAKMTNGIFEYRSVCRSWAHALDCLIEMDRSMERDGTANDNYFIAVPNTGGNG